MDIFTINLDSRPDRWNRVMAIQRAYPWARLHRLPAVSIPLLPTAACTASHQLAVAIACADDLPQIVVAEDDLEPTRFFPQWPAIVAKADEMGLDYVIGATATTEDARKGPEKPWSLIPAGGECSIVEAGNGRGTHLICYFARAYQKVLNLQFGIPIDAALGMNPELRGGFAFPYVAVQGDGYSDLAHRPYDTPMLYMKSADVWAKRLEVKVLEPWEKLLERVLPVSDGPEAVQRFSMTDLVRGRKRLMPATFDPSIALEAKHG